jgi:hypothetical protein
MPSQREIAKDWQCAHSYIAKCVNNGCPTDSFESARAWRKLHASKRATTSPKQLAKLVLQEKDDDSSDAREHRKEFLNDRPEGTRLPLDTSLEDALVNARQAAAEAWRLLSESMTANQDDLIGVRLSVHNKALEALFRAESAYREELERRRILIPLAEAMETARRGYQVILQRLKALPQNVAPRCNPADPNRAMTVLESECTAILGDAQMVYASWSNDQAPASNSSQL